MQIQSMLVLSILIIGLVSCAAAPEPFGHMPKFVSGKQVGTLQTELLQEASGIVASRSNPGVLWVHNDSGDAPRVYAINSKGTLLGIYRIAAAKSLDWEDIAIGPSPDPKQDYLYIGDIGDNRAKRPSVAVYRIQEPKVRPNQSLVDMEVGPADSFNLRYPDGPKDAETLMVDPLSGDIYIISKRDIFSKVYRALYPCSTDETITMELVATLPWGLAVGGDVSPDGNLVIVRGLYNASLWQRPKGQELWRAFTGRQFKLEVVAEPQGEGIGFDSQGRGYFTIGEMLHAPLYYFASSNNSEESISPP
jgi:hypothetical protein